MDNKPVYLTPEGLESLRAELEELVNVRRPALVARLTFAIKQGDLSENADYITAKEEQGFLEGRIQELQMMLRNAVLIDPSKTKPGRVGLGCQVTVLEEDYDEPETYFVVGAAEADPGNGKISNESPLGSALLGHKVGDWVSVTAPAGKIRFRIQKIE
ncbi:MAG: transcription elongation factor GreA [Anaerolineae bacterium]|nr:transcription elongation factor GreA [Anaerolineae bacterium]